MTEEMQLHVEGMSCGHCVKAVESSVGAIDVVETVRVTLDQGLVEVTYNPRQASVEDMKAAIEEEGYTVK